MRLKSEPYYLGSASLGHGLNIHAYAVAPPNRFYHCRPGLGISAADWCRFIFQALYYLLFKPIPKSTIGVGTCTNPTHRSTWRYTRYWCAETGPPNPDNSTKFEIPSIIEPKVLKFFQGRAIGNKPVKSGTFYKIHYIWLDIHQVFINFEIQIWVSTVC